MPPSGQVLRGPKHEPMRAGTQPVSSVRHEDDCPPTRHPFVQVKGFWSPVPPPKGRRLVRDGPLPDSAFSSPGASLKQMIRNEMWATTATSERSERTAADRSRLERMYLTHGSAALRLAFLLTGNRALAEDI